MTWLGIDIGGANLKLADYGEFAACYAFPLWKTPELLAARLRQSIEAGPACNALAVTMTGELADCFASKSAGVSFILEAVAKAAGGRPVFVYQTTGQFVTLPEAVAQPLLTAAANWHALAAFAVRFVNRRPALLLDVGSTTVDLVPLIDGQPQPAGFDDTTRLLESELVYTGIERTPVCAVARRVLYRGRSCPLAAELFASMQDVYLLTGDLPEQPENSDTADGRPRTRDAATARLGRMLCADEMQFDQRDARRMARDIAAAQRESIALAVQQVLRRMPDPLSVIVLSGHGEFLARRMLRDMGIDVPQISLASRLGRGIARSAAAHAVAVLARERIEI